MGVKPSKPAVSDIASLSAEMLRLIFRLLPPRDMKTVLLVSKLWMEVGGSPELWTWAVLRGTTDNWAVMPKLLGSRRLRRVAGLKTSGVEGGRLKWTRELFQGALRHEGLVKVDFSGTDLSLVPPGMLAMLTSQLEEASFRRTYLTCQQIEAVLGAVRSGNRLEKLDLEGSGSVSSVEPCVLASAVTKVEEVCLRATQLTGVQVEAILAAINKDTQLRTLDLGGNTSLATVNPRLLACAVNRLEGVSLDRTDLTTEQIEEILMVIPNASMMKQIDLSGNPDLFDVEPDLLARAVNRLVDVTLGGTWLTIEQTETIFTGVCKETQLKKLNIGTIIQLVPLLDPFLVARSVLHLKNIDLGSHFLKLYFFYVWAVWNNFDPSILLILMFLKVFRWGNMTTFVIFLPLFINDFAEIKARQTL